MPPHCDSLDGPVVSAAREALASSDIDKVLPFVPENGEEEVRSVFAAALPVRGLSEAAREVADRLFFETVVRVHRAGEGAAYTGLKPAGLDVGPVIPLAERAVATGSSEALADYLTAAVRDQLRHRIEKVNLLAAGKDRSVGEARAWVEGMLGFEVYSHHLFEAINASAHPGHGDAEVAAGHSHG